MASGSKRRANGEGTLQQLPSGLWRCLRTVDGRKIAGPAKPSRTQAQAALKAKLEGANAGERRSLSSWATCRIEALPPSTSPTTIDSYRKWARSLARDPLGDVPVSQVMESDLRAWWSRARLADTTKRKRLGWIRQLLRDAGSLADYRPPKRERHERRPLSAEEALRLRAVVADAPELDRIAALICLELGLRCSEACGLCHEDREGDGVRIQRAVARSTGEVRVKRRGKSASALAWVPLPPSLSGAVGPPKKGFVLGEGKRPMYPDRLRAIVKRLLAQAGVSVPYGGPHTLRRSYGMALLEAGVDIVTAAELMRHDPATLLGEYARSRRDLKTSAVDKAFGQVDEDVERHTR